MKAHLREPTLDRPENFVAQAEKRTHVDVVGNEYLEARLLPPKGSTRPGVIAAVSAWDLTGRHAVTSTSDSLIAPHGGRTTPTAKRRPFAQLRAQSMLLPALRPRPSHFRALSLLRPRLSDQQTCP